jgi:DNA-binding transcriptional regulator GbsR (MarR family)
MKQLSDAIRRFVDDTGLLLEAAGMPRIAGQVLGWLLVCEPEAQSLNDLSEALSISKASASTTTRMLTQFGLIERTLLAGDRRDYYRVADDAWHRFFQSRMATMHKLQRNAERGLQLLADAPPDRRARLERMRTLFAFLEREMSRLMRQFEVENAAGSHASANHAAEPIGAERSGP